MKPILFFSSFYPESRALTDSQSVMFSLLPTLRRYDIVNSEFLLIMTVLLGLFQPKPKFVPPLNNILCMYLHYNSTPHNSLSEWYDFKDHLES